MAKKSLRPGGRGMTSSSSGSSLGRPSNGIKPEARAANLVQLRRAKGQVEGIERMIQDDRYVADVIVQITAARASLLSVAKSLLAEHLRSCHEAAIRNGGLEADQMYQELVDLVGKMSK